MAHLESETEWTSPYVEKISFLPIWRDVQTTCKYHYQLS